MSQEFMLYIRNAGDAKASLPETKHLEFIKKCEIYIGKLKAKGKLIAAQPLLREGLLLSKQKEAFLEQPLNLLGETQVGYYHIKVKDMAEAIAIAKENPEFIFVPSASIEIRPVKTKEEATNFSYPT